MIFATGYRPVCPLGAARRGAIAVRHRRGRDGAHRARLPGVATTCETPAGIYLQGATEHTHGIGSTLLSNTAVRAGEILASIVRHLPRRRSNGLEQLLWITGAT